MRLLLFSSSSRAPSPFLVTADGLDECDGSRDQSISPCLPKSIMFLFDFSWSAAPNPISGIPSVTGPGILLAQKYHFMETTKHDKMLRKTTVVVTSSR